MGEAKRKVRNRERTLPALYRRAEVLRLIGPDHDVATVRYAGLMHDLARLQQARPEGRPDATDPESRPQHYMRQGVWTVADRRFVPVAQGRTAEEALAMAGRSRQSAGPAPTAKADGFDAIVTYANEAGLRIYHSPPEVILVDERGAEIDAHAGFEGMVRICEATGSVATADLNPCAQVLAAAWAPAGSAHPSHAAIAAGMAIQRAMGEGVAVDAAYADGRAALQMADLLKDLDPELSGADALEAALEAAEEAEDAYVSLQQGAWRGPGLRLIEEHCPGVIPIQVRKVTRPRADDREVVARLESEFDMAMARLNRDHRHRRAIAVPKVAGRLLSYDPGVGPALAAEVVKMIVEFESLGGVTEFSPPGGPDSGKYVAGHIESNGANCAALFNRSGVIAYVW